MKNDLKGFAQKAIILSKQAKQKIKGGTNDSSQPATGEEDNGIIVEDGGAI